MRASPAVFASVTRRIASLLLLACSPAVSCGPDELPAFANPPPVDSGWEMDDGGDPRDAGNP